MMTEPELVTLGDNVCVDEASIIAHINTQGNFSLNHIDIGRGATLHYFSRVLSGASVLAGGTLLEHTLILPGDIVDAYTTWQGWPAVMIPESTMGSKFFHSCGASCECSFITIVDDADDIVSKEQSSQAF